MQTVEVTAHKYNRAGRKLIFQFHLDECRIVFKPLKNCQTVTFFCATANSTHEDRRKTQLKRVAQAEPQGRQSMGKQGTPACAMGMLLAKISAEDFSQLV